MANHQWANVGGYDAKHCSNCGITVGAIEVCDYWKSRGQADNDADALHLGWPKEGCTESKVRRRWKPGEPPTELPRG